MAYTAVDMIQEFGEQVGQLAGDEVRERLMAGAEALSNKTKPGEISLRMKGAVERLDAAGDRQAHHGSLWRQLLEGQPAHYRARQSPPHEV
jgi:hypothetical protein